MSIASALSTTIGSQSASTLVLSGLLAVVISIFGYRLSQRVRATRGVTPWRIPSAVWALICFFFAPFGFALELIAIVSTRPVPGKIQPAHGPAEEKAPSMYSTQGIAPSTTDQHSGEVTTTEQALSAYVPKSPPSGYGGPPSDHFGKPALFGWYHDVTKRHELRYWDGRDWTKFVSDDGVTDEDPLT